MARRIYFFAAIVFFPILSMGTPSSAQVLDAFTGMQIPNALACQAPHAGNGGLVPARQILGPSPHFAHSFWAPDGWPSIVYGQGYFQIPPLMQIFTSAHECGHLVNASANEPAANCFALQTLGLTPSQKLFIAQFHQNLGPLPPQYGGSGMQFWQMTRQLCPQFTD